MGLGACGAQGDQLATFLSAVFLFIEEILDDRMVCDLAEDLDVDHAIGVEFHRDGVQDDEGCSVL